MKLLGRNKGLGMSAQTTIVETEQLVSPHHESHHKSHMVEQTEDYVKKGATRTCKVFGGVGKDFGAFISRGNVVDLAVGIVMGTAFLAVVNSFVADIIMPFIGLAGGSSFDQLYVVLRAPNNQSCITQNVDCSNIHTIAQLNSVGGISWNYGRFIQYVITFLITAIIVFMFVRSYAVVFLRVAPVLVTKPPPMKACQKCTEQIPAAALKCKFCTADQEDEHPEIVIAKEPPTGKERKSA